MDVSRGERELEALLQEGGDRRHERPRQDRLVCDWVAPARELGRLTLT
jgi:hypothetical protein